ncbi:MbeD/MobD family mobilization/exclusion protein, partial [Cronobacter sakazakii]|nr:MbeD/MobD family mobilization/exclusion protein [Cronobacter sakazakii]
MLSALEQLQQDYSKRLDEWENAFAEWGTMSGFFNGRRRAGRGRPGLWAGGGGGWGGAGGG